MPRHSAPTTHRWRQPWRREWCQAAAQALAGTGARVCGWDWMGRGSGLEDMNDALSGDAWAVDRGRRRVAGRRRRVLWTWRQRSSKPTLGRRAWQHGAMRSPASPTLALLLAALGCMAQAAELPYGTAVAARFPDPERVYATPGLQPGRESFTS